MSNKHNRPDQQQGKSNQYGGQDRQRHDQNQQHQKPTTTEQGKKDPFNQQRGQRNNPTATQGSTGSCNTQNSSSGPTKQR